MTELFSGYSPTLWCLLVTGGLVLLQLLVADVTGILRGRVPGSAVADSHDDFLFRATRAHANTNESVAAFVLLALVGVGFGADPGWINGLAMTYVGGRIAHMLCYWAGQSILRSVSFIVSFAALFGLLVVDLLAAL